MYLLCVQCVEACPLTLGLTVLLWVFLHAWQLQQEELQYLYTHAKNRTSVATQYCSSVWETHMRKSFVCGTNKVASSTSGSYFVHRATTASVTATYESKLPLYLEQPHTWITPGPLQYSCESHIMALLHVFHCRMWGRTARMHIFIWHKFSVSRAGGISLVLWAQFIKNWIIFIN